MEIRERSGERVVFTEIGFCCFERQFWTKYLKNTEFDLYKMSFFLILDNSFVHLYKHADLRFDEKLSSTSAPPPAWHHFHMLIFFSISLSRSGSLELRSPFLRQRVPLYWSSLGIIWLVGLAHLFSKAPAKHHLSLNFGKWLSTTMLR